MERIKALIIEDDYYNVIAVTKIIENHFPEIQIIGNTGRVNESIQKIEEYKPQLLLMDIHLMDGTSFDVLKNCQYKDMKIVFMSAYHEYSIKAMQYAAVEFVYKPYDINELIVAIDKATDQTHYQDYAINIDTLINNIEENPTSKLVLQGRKSVKVVAVNEVVWCKAIYGGANFYLSDNSYFFTNKPLRRYEAMLSGRNFFRCHPHYLINLNHVTEINTKLERVKLSTDDEVVYEARRYSHLKNLLESNITFEQAF